MDETASAGPLSKPEFADIMNVVYKRPADDHAPGRWLRARPLGLAQTSMQGPIEDIIDEECRLRQPAVVGDGPLSACLPRGLLVSISGARPGGWTPFRGCNAARSPRSLLRGESEMIGAVPVSE